MKLYGQIVNNYDKNNLIIKTHPRDNIPYEQLFPGIVVFRKKVPSQLIDLVGVHFKKAITVFSSAALSFAYPIQVDWYGTEIHPKVLSIYGHYTPPSEARLCEVPKAE